MKAKKLVLENYYPSAKCITSSSGYVIIIWDNIVIGLGKSSYKAWKAAYEYCIK